MSERLREIRDREQAATEGPWEARQEGPPTCWSRYKYTETISDFHGGYCWHFHVRDARGRDALYLGVDVEGASYTDPAPPPSPNAEFIAHARSDIPWLIDRLEETLDFVYHRARRTCPVHGLKWASNDGGTCMLKHPSGQREPLTILVEDLPAWLSQDMKEK